MPKNLESPSSEAMSHPEDHKWHMEHTPGYRYLIESGLNSDEAFRFMALAVVENHAPWNLDERQKADLAEMRKRLPKNGIETTHSDN